MKHDHFEPLEHATDGDTVALSEVIGQLAFNEHGLIPVITQDAKSRQVLMLAWMNLDAVEKTLSTKRVTYRSRSRKQLWIKGETSGHTQELVSMSFDCDGDSILCLVNQSGAACHTGRPDCFYLKVESNQEKIIVSGNYKT